MKILVCISNVPDTTTKVKFNEERNRLDVNGIQWIINPWDELALTRALELKDEVSNGVQSVTIAHVGTAASEPTIRKALAVGADDAIRVNAESGDSYSVAALLSEALKELKFDIIFCGIESSDYNGSTVGGMLAEFLSIPSVTGVSDIIIEEGIPVLTREIDGGKEIMTISPPFVAVIQKGIAKEPRIAAMRGIMTARSKSIKVVDPQHIETLTEVVSFEKPAPRVECKYVNAEDAGQLIYLLQNEAKVI